jgi:hypothetical protein
MYHIYHNTKKHDKYSEDVEQFKLLGRARNKSNLRALRSQNKVTFGEYHVRFVFRLAILKYVLQSTEL